MEYRFMMIFGTAEKPSVKKEAASDSTGALNA
jgi:hypothetical protein